MRYLLPEKGQFYKANLHCHSTLSDGNLTPEELKKAYKEHGYSILAITDHEYMVDHTDMSEEGFLMLNGYEMYVKDMMEPELSRFYHTTHLNFIAKTPDVNKHIMVDPRFMRYAARYHAVEDLPRVGDLCTRTYTVSCINRIIKQANENGYLVFYNHPVWSREDLTDVMQYQGLMGMEIYNHGVYATEGYASDDAQTYDTLLRMGQRLKVFANDDNHNKYPFGDPLCDSFGGFNMIKAEKLDYETVIAAIENGDFYASTGPTIEKLYMEGNKIHVECSPAREVFLRTEPRNKAKNRIPHIGTRAGEVITHAEFEVLPEDGYVRLEIMDHAGKKAYTRAYFVDELL